ncbi:hypothetical protein RhiirA5_431162 [Rhizophagus irregularis]|uniref:Uncharacterized protein n=1 Tax=Rhizophagus irregularis TaxID=588596 RepID=A0A2N0NVG1_9GLOM|nr:hypothetical protein RhiirA5_431162 [Rhizophagus irregularis]PKC56889.1 hypothetical protein RhiirA1_473348 [Rhizophagus irregularis]
MQQKGIVNTLFFDIVYPLIFEVAEDENLQVCKEIYKRLISTTEKVLDILKDQQDKGNFKWVKSVEKNF